MSKTVEFCYILNGKGGAQKGSRSCKTRPRQPVWIHVDYQNESSRSWLLRQKLAAPILENLIDEDVSPRYFLHHNSVLIVMRGINASGDIDDMVALRILIEKNRIITLSHRPVSAMVDVLQRLQHGVGPKTIGDCFIMLAKSMMDGIEVLVSKISDGVDAVDELVASFHETNSGSKTDDVLRNEISDLRHTVVGLRRYLVPQYDSMRLMQGTSNSFLSDENLAQLNEIYRDMGNAVAELNFARDHSTVTREELDSKTSIAMSHSMYLMSIIMVIFTPLTFITGLLGANVGGIPFYDNPNGFVFVSGILIVIVLLQLFLIKKLRWF